MDHGTRLVFGVVLVTIGLVWLVRAYRGTKLHQHITTLNSPELEAMSKNERRMAILIGTMSFFLAIGYFFEAMGR